jgi:4,5-DOPA dioxygenase extradiol
MSRATPPQATRPLVEDGEAGRPTTRLPALFVSHGSPMQALEGGDAARAWRALAAELPRPRAVLVVSAHWETRAPAIGTTAQPETIHDFGGFPDALFRIQYRPPGAPWLAGRVRALLGAHGFTLTADPERGLDHGAWVPLREMYPDADVPAAQLSIQPHLGPGHHLALGRALADIADDGVLLLASGSLTHNLRDWRPGAAGDRATIAPYVREFQQWMSDALTRRDFEALSDYRRRAPQAQRAHPSDEHLLPVFVAAGAGGEHAIVRRVHDGVAEHALAMDVYAFERPQPAG